MEKKDEIKIFNLQSEKDRQAFDELIKTYAPHRVDTFAEQLYELYACQHPQHFHDKQKIKEGFIRYRESLTKHTPLEQQGVWVWYPWLNLVTHLLAESDFQLLRTVRNQHLISAAEQQRFYNSCIGIAGLSIGSNVVAGLTLTGGAKHLKLADPDTIALSNINRLHADISHLGLPKTTVATRQALLRNPFTQVELFVDGITADNIATFVSGCDVVIDEMDSLPMKVRLRQEAKRQKIPVIMLTDDADDVILDVERYDLNPETMPFHGRIKDLEKLLDPQFPPHRLGQVIIEFVGAENIAERKQFSLMEIGKTIATYPQLGTAASLSGIMAAYVVRRIVNQLPVTNNRAIINLDEILDPTYYSPEARQRRQQRLQAFRDTLEEKD